MWNDTHMLPDIPRDPVDGSRLVSEWVDVMLADGKTIIKAYYHYLYGWMVRGPITGLFVYGYIPLTDTVIKWRYN